MCLCVCVCVWYVCAHVHVPVAMVGLFCMVPNPPLSTKASRNCNVQFAMFRSGSALWVLCATGFRLPSGKYGSGRT